MKRPSAVISRDAFRHSSFAIRHSAAALLLLPLFAFGHSTEFLDAKFYFDPSGKAHVEITADYAGNPMLSTKEEAEAALREAMALSIDGKEHSLIEFAPVVVAPRARPDPDSPMPTGPEDPKTPHSLLTLSWSWQPGVKALRFIVPQASNQTVIFWMKEAGVDGPRWKMLSPGEMTPPIFVPKQPVNWWLALCLILLPALVGARLCLFEALNKESMRPKA